MATAHSTQPLASGQSTAIQRGGRSSPDDMRQRISSADISMYDAALMPEAEIRHRELHQYSVHFNVANAKWVATLVQPKADTTNMQPDVHGLIKQRCVSFSFGTEREARKFAQCYTPPKMVLSAKNCTICDSVFDRRKNTACNCKNCGAAICEKCSSRWGVKMIPKTYVATPLAALTVRVCKSCDWLSNAFCMALLQGRFNDAVKLFGSGNVNLRSSFADIRKEAMFPVHCAVLGGNLDLLKWLVERQGCPISVKRDSRTGHMLSVQTSSGRTLIDLAMTGKPKIDILSYLIRKNMSVFDTKDPQLAPMTLQTIMKPAFRIEARGESFVTPLDGSIHTIDGCDSSVATGVEDACVICCEKAMDCALVPCGHQICCSDCGNRLSCCPICKKESTVLKIYRM